MKNERIHFNTIKDVNKNSFLIVDLIGRRVYVLGSTVYDFDHICCFLVAYASDARRLRINRDSGQCQTGFLFIFSILQG